MVSRISIAAALAAFSIATAAAQGTGLVREVVVRGNQRVTREAVLAAMRTKTGQPYVQATLDADKQSLEELGFFRAVDVRAEAVEGTDWRVLVDLAEWPEIKEIRIAGNSVIPTDQILAVIAIKPGEIFNLSAVGPSREAIQKLYLDKQFFGLVTRFEPLEESPNTLNVVIVETKVVEVIVEGNDKTNDRVINRLIKTRPGDVYNVNLWREDLRRLLATRWFEDYESVPEPRAVGEIALRLQVKEARTGNLGLGLQLDPRSSLAGFIRLDETNFRGTGQALGLNLMQSTRGGGTSIDVHYSNPFLDNRDTSMSVSLYSRIVYRFTGSAFGGDDTPTDDNRYAERRTGGSIGFSRPIQQNLFASIGTRLERIKTSDLDTTTSTDFIQQDGDLATITLGLIRNTRDVDLDPARGEWASLSIQPGWANITKVGGAVSDELEGRSSYVKSSIEYRRYYSPQRDRTVNELSEPRRVIAGRIRYGRIDGTAPFFEQFFAGGSDTLRGYDEDRFWGRYTLLSSLEYRHPIQKAFNIIAFVDYGGAWGGYGTVGDFIQTDDLDLKLGYGLGMSFRIPALGSIRLDFGFNEEGKSRTHFIIGTSF